MRASQRELIIGESRPARKKLSELNEAYARVGLLRSRRVFLATASGHSQPIGVACAYRGPLGLNFSFLESRCDMWLDACLDEPERQSAASALVDACRPSYDDCPLPRTFW